MSIQLKRTMMSAFAVFAMVAASVAPAVAQTQQRHEGLGIGIKGGPVFNKFATDLDDVRFDTRAGLQGGIFFGGNRPGTVGVMGEINFIQKKAEGVKLNYLQVPVLLRINAGSNSLSGVNVYGVAGPAVDVKISDDLDGFGDLDNSAESVDISVIGGVGVEITRFIIEGRYTWGLRQINKDSSSAFDTVKIKSRSFALLFGIRFN
jgi:hypothetical protein